MQGTDPYRALKRRTRPRLAAPTRCPTAHTLPTCMQKVHIIVMCVRVRAIFERACQGGVRFDCLIVSGLNWLIRRSQPLHVLPVPIRQTSLNQNFDFSVF